MTSKVTDPVDTRRTQHEVNKLANMAARGIRPKPRLVFDGVRIERPRGYRGCGDHIYQFGDTYSVEAKVENGKVVRKDHKPYRG